MAWKYDVRGACLLDERFPLPLDAPFTATMARQQGINANQLTRLVQEGFLRRVLKGVYVATQVSDSLTLRTDALRLVVPEGGVVTDRTAGWLHGARMILAPNDHLVVPPVAVFMTAPGLRLRNDVCASGERTLEARDITTVRGIRVTTPLRTACDLGRLLHKDQAFAALDSLLGLGAFTRTDLVREVRRFRGYRGVIQLRALAPLADPRAESPGESILRLRWLEVPGLPRPEPQLAVDGPNGASYYLDLGVEALRFAAEYDGEAFHGEAHEEHDRRRRDWVERAHGYRFVVVRRHHLFGPQRQAQEMLIDGITRARAALGRKSRRVDESSRGSRAGSARW